MLRNRLFALAIAGLSVLCVARAGTITENFSTDPLQHGWKVAGDTNLFQWDAAHHRLAVTWDSTQPNGFFYYPLSGHLTRQDDFGFEFDLELSDAATVVESGKSTPLQVALGFQNQSAVTNGGFVRGNGLVSNIVEFAYYPEGYWVWPPGVSNDSPASVVPSLISSASSFAPKTLDPYYVLEVPRNQLMHVSMTYTAATQTATIAITTNGVPLGPLPSLWLYVSTNSSFAPGDNFSVDMFSITSYSGIEDDWNSLRAHGTVANLRIQTPLPDVGTRFPVADLRCGSSNGVWQVQFSSQTNWVYSLERTTDFASWGGASTVAAGNGGQLVLQDTNAPAERAFYRVRAQLP